MTTKQQQIIEAAEALSAEGITPTMEKVRERLGGGSFATISPVLRAWKAEHQAEVVQAQEAPPEAIEAGTKAAAVIWSAAMQTAASRIEDAETKAEERAAEAEREREEALAEITRLEVEAGVINATAAQAVADLDTERQSHAETRTEAATAKTQAEERAGRIKDQAEALEQAKADALNSAGRESRLTGELEQAQEQADTSAGRLAEVEKRATAETLRADRAESTADQAKDHAADLEREIGELRAEAKVIGKEVAQAKADANSAARLITSAEAKTDAAEVREREASKEAAKLSGKLEALTQAKPEKAQNRTPRGRA